MSTPATKRRANQPAIPPVSVETWKAVLAAADDFNRLAPWEWMHDSQIVGLRHPVTKEVLLGSILGRLRTVFALLVYRRDSGHRWLLNTILNEGNPGGLEDEDTALDRKSGFVGGFHLNDVKDSDGAGALGKVLQNTLQQLGHRPEAIRVQRPRVAAMLSRVAMELGIPVLQDAELPALNSVRDDMESRFSR